MLNLKSFTDFAKDINLVDFFVSHEGFSIDKDKSAKNVHTGWVVLDLKGNAGATIETLLVKYTSDSSSPFYGQYFYLNANDKNDRGSIVNYIASRKGLDTKAEAAQINDILNKYLGNPTTSNYTPKERDYKLLASNNKFNAFDLKYISTHVFFNSRGITSKTINHPFFKNKIQEHHRKDDLENKTYINPAFPMVNTNGKVVGAELKNYDFKGNASNSLKNESVFISNKIAGQVNYFIIGESGLDCLSHFQLNFLKLKNTNVIYVSTGGNLVSGQIDVINFYIKKYSPLNVVLINDNDEQGVIYNINLIASFSNLYFYVQKNKKIITVSFQNNTAVKTLLASLNPIEINDKDLVFTSDVEVLKNMESLLIKHGYASDNLIIERAKGKDFNEDLMKL